MLPCAALGIRRPAARECAWRLFPCPYQETVFLPENCRMRKMRDDSTWNQLTPEQRETLESWLFDENLGYAKTLARVQEEFGLEATIASVGRFYRRRARERQVEELVEAQAAANELNDLPVSVASLREAAVKLVGKAALKLAGEKQIGRAH